MNEKEIKIREPQVDYAFDIEEGVDENENNKVEIFHVTDEEYERLKPRVEEARASGYIKNFSFDVFLLKAKKKYAERES